MIFNDKGEVNAHDRQDAMQQLVRYASILANSQPSTTFPSDATAAPSYSNQEREEMLKRALLTLLV